MRALEFETGVAELENKIEELRKLAGEAELDAMQEIARMHDKVKRRLTEIYAKLTPWQKVLVARHEDRPRARAYISQLFRDFQMLAGDRRFGEDPAIVGGLGRLHGQAVMVIGLERGTDTPSRLAHNFGMARPEGYRKAQRLMLMAARFKIPLITLIDTPGADPDVEAENRGQAEAIASCIATCLDVEIPVVALIIGEGGSGGAVALGAADRVLILEHAVYSVISPEGCASILWRSGDHTKQAAEILRLTAQDLKGFGVIDEIVAEPAGGAHRHREASMNAAGMLIHQKLKELMRAPYHVLRMKRREHFMAMDGVSHKLSA